MAILRWLRRRRENRQAAAWSVRERELAEYDTANCALDGILDRRFR